MSGRISHSPVYQSPINRLYVRGSLSSLQLIIYTHIVCLSIDDIHIFLVFSVSILYT